MRSAVEQSMGGFVDVASKLNTRPGVQVGIVHIGDRYIAVLAETAARMRVSKDGGIRAGHESGTR